MKKVLGLFFGFMLCTAAYSKVHHDYIIELCEDEDLCVILSAQGESTGFIATQEVVDEAKAEGIDLNVVVVCEDFYLQAAEGLDRHEISSFFEDDNDDFLEVSKGGKGEAFRKLKKIYDQWERGGKGGGGEGSGSGGGSGGGGKKTCGKCHTDGKHSHHPPTGD